MFDLSVNQQRIETNQATLRASLRGINERLRELESWREIVESDLATRGKRRARNANA
jgi:hypothetical protein